jgi:YD repeat-containing protein
VKVFTRASGLERLPKQEQRTAHEALDRSVSLARAVREQMPVAEPLLVTALAGEGAGYRAFALPGGDTRALAPARLDEADLVVPLEGSDGIRLVRSFNSFFNPSGPWGQGWALDLPRLDEARVPERRDAEGGVSYRIVPELTTPLNSLHARFSRTAAVPELKASELQVPDQPGEFLALAGGQPDFLSKPTRILIRKDGELWHFSEAGDLVATERRGFRIVYERDAEGRVTRILGLQGTQPVASIRLTYDEASGRLQSATGQRETGGAARGQDQVSVRYDYDADGSLVAVRSDQGRTGYRYEGTRVTAVTYRAPENAGGPVPEDVTVRRFEYDPRGQLLAETDAAGARTAYRVVADATGRTITAVQEGHEARAESVRYDPAFRPIEARYADGTKASWTYPKDGGTAMTLAQADGETVTLIENADLSQRTLMLDQDRRLVGHYDSAGRLTSLTDNGALLLRQAWSPNGHLTLAADETTAVHPGYDADGLLTRVLVTPPDEQGEFTHWQETKLDPAGRPREINDYRGLKVAMDYDGAGDLIALATERDGKNYGYRLSRDASGRIQEVTSSWGRQQYRYDDEGRLQRLDMTDGDANAHIEWQAGQLARVNQFDGGTLAIDYDRNGSSAGLPEKITTPNALELKYEYDAARRLTGVDVGGQSRLTLGYDGRGRLAAWTYSQAEP